MSTQSDPDETRIRLRAVLDAQFTLLLVGCLVLAAAGGFLVYGTYVDPGTEEETRTVSSWTVDSEYVHAAEVTAENPVFEVGSTLENRETYFSRIAPQLDVAAEASYTAEQSENVRIDVESELVIRNVGDGVEYWEERETLAETTVEDVEPGETVGAEFTLDSAAIDQQASDIEEDLGASPGQTETEVLTTVELEGTLNGEAATYTRSMEFGIDHGGDTYTVNDPGPQSDTTSQEVTETVERTYGPLRSIGAPLLLVIGVVAGAGLSYARYEGRLAVSDAERAYLSYRDDRSEFDEWITRIRLPPAAHDRPVAYADSLRDLVDFAIDNDTGVVEDPDTGAFHAVTGDFVYTYRRPDPPVHRSTGEDSAGPDADAAEDGVGVDADPLDDGEGSTVDTADVGTSVADKNIGADGEDDDDERSDEEANGDGGPDPFAMGPTEPAERDTDGDDSTDSPETNGG